MIDTTTHRLDDLQLNRSFSHSRPSHIHRKSSDRPWQVLDKFFKKVKLSSVADRSRSITEVLWTFFSHLDLQCTVAVVVEAQNYFENRSSNVIKKLSPWRYFSLSQLRWSFPVFLPICQTMAAEKKFSDCLSRWEFQPIL